MGSLPELSLEELCDPDNDYVCLILFGVDKGDLSQLPIAVFSNSSLTFTLVSSVKYRLY